MRSYFAPMEGITTHIYRRVHARLFGGADRYYAPFIAPDGSGNFRAASARDVLPENNTGIALVPQLLCNRAEPVSRRRSATGRYRLQGGQSEPRLPIRYGRLEA